MQPVIPPSCYFDPGVFEAEKRLIFAANWYFVGLASEVANHQDFLTADIAGKSVVVQNFEGEIRAFHNVCSHRFSKIQNETCGNRRFQCPYHGWVYDKEGKPYAIPKRPKFPEMDDALMTELSLTRFSLERCGQLLFVRISPEGVSLREYLGELYEPLAEMSEGVGARIDRNALVIEANWKICVENTLESYHVGFVHKDTFKRLGLADGGFHFYGPHSTWTGVVDEAIAKKYARAEKLFASRPYKIPGYRHIVVFPATTIATTYGSSFAFQDFHPISPSQTVFTSHVFTCRLNEEDEKSKTMIDLMNTSVVEFNRSVFEEDRVVVEYVQKGSEQTQRAGILSDEEERVCAYQHAYAERMAEVIGELPQVAAASRLS